MVWLFSSGAFQEDRYLQGDVSTLFCLCSWHAFSGDSTEEFEYEALHHGVAQLAEFCSPVYNIALPFVFFLVPSWGWPYSALRALPLGPQTTTSLAPALLFSKAPLHGVGLGGMRSSGVHKGQVLRSSSARIIVVRAENVCISVKQRTLSRGCHMGIHYAHVRTI